MSLNDTELERFENELKSVRPAQPPADFLQRLKSEAPALVAERWAQPAPPDRSAAPVTMRPIKHAAWSAWVAPLLRWMVPATVLLALAAIVWQANQPGGLGSETAVSPMIADDVQIDQQLVSTFDAVAPLPNGEPMRFRCQQWLDEVVLRDSKRGVEVTRRVPRVEVVPVSFETY